MSSGEVTVEGLEGDRSVGEGLDASEPWDLESLVERDRSRLFVVLAAPGGAVDGVTADLGARLEAAVAPHGARVSLLVDGAVLALLSGQGTRTEQAMRAARTALALGAALPGAPVAAVTGAGSRVDEVPLGDMVERAARMLLASSSTPAILIDEALAGLLDGRFLIRDDARGPLLEGEVDPGSASPALDVEPGAVAR
jgi:hypothetical protein